MDPLFRHDESGTTEEEFVENVKLLADLGWPAIRTGFHSGRGADEPDTVFEPRESLGLTAQWLTAARAAVGPEPVLGIDYHHRLSVAEAASFCQRMPAGTLDFLEEPIRDETPAAYEALRSMTDVPFAIGEDVFEQVAVPPLRRARHHTVRAYRRLQCGRPDRGR